MVSQSRNIQDGYQTSTIYLYTFSLINQQIVECLAERFSINPYNNAYNLQFIEINMIKIYKMTMIYLV